MNPTSNAAQNQRVRTVGSRIVSAANLDNRLSWEYAVFQNDSPNAFVLPNGKIGVTTGLLNLVRNDDQLSAVIGHEVGHVVARHAAERYSQTALTATGLQVARGAAGDYGQAVGALGGIGAQLGVLLPFSRNHELEADRLGVDYMAAAGYQPARGHRPVDPDGPAAPGLHSGVRLHPPLGPDPHRPVGAVYLQPRLVGVFCA